MGTTNGGVDVLQAAMLVALAAVLASQRDKNSPLVGGFPCIVIRKHGVAKMASHNSAKSATLS